jgi:hypothetical protein
MAVAKPPATLRRLDGLAARDRPQGHLGRVGEAVATLRLGLRSGGELAQSLRERDEHPGQVAAVDGGDVPWQEWRERGRVVPVEQMPPESFESPHRIEECLERLEQRRRAHVAEIVRGQRGQHPHGNVGGRRAVRDPRLRHFLEVVGWQPVVLRAHERLEETPRLPCRDAEQQPILGGEAMAFGDDGLAQPECDERREEPERGNGNGRGQRVRPRDADRDDDRDREDGACGHLREEQTHAAPRRQSRRARRGGCGCLPIQQPTLGDEHAHQRQHDGVHHLEPVVHEEHDLEQHLRRGRLRVLEQQAEVHADRCCAGGPASVRTSTGYSGNASEPRISAVHSHGDPGSSSHAPTSAMTAAGGTSVRRRLSRIFQREMVGSVLRATPSRVGTSGKSQSRICQSPRPTDAGGVRGSGRCGVVVDHLDVGDQGGSRMQALEEVVREQRIVRHPPSSAAMNTSRRTGPCR